jgi:geranylgeranyl diphosphate synthase type I|tara:strand:- start:136 stop:1119 length:984 start_codon:yes stop_codon:yes gene_type:complete
MKVSDSIKKNATLVNKFLRKELKGNPKQLYNASAYLIIHGGKRLRPFMVLKSCMMFGGKQSDAMAAASAVEMIHNFTLTHDDIMDNDDMRHGVPTTHKKFDMPLAILAGDVLYSKAYHTISSKSKLGSNYTSQLVTKLSKACIEICEGQVDDIKLAENKRIPTESEYIKMIEKKTAVLFEVSCAMGAICAKKSAKDVRNMSTFGRNLGIAFQITDDLIGVMGDSKVTGKAVGNDIREGKKSLPILLAIRKARGSNKKKILRVFGKSKTNRAELNTAVGIIRSLGIEEAVRKQALRYANRATKALDKYSGVHKSELISLLDFVVKRSL